MFRAMRRFKQQVTDEECRRILQEEPRAALAVNGDEGYPYAVPINFYYAEDENRIYYHGAGTGHKVDAIQRCDKVCLTVWNQGYHREGHWEWTATSVVIFGRAHEVTDPVILEDRLRRLAQKYYPTAEEIEAEIGRDLSHVHMYAIDIEHMSGKLVNEK